MNTFFSSWPLEVQQLPHAVGLPAYATQGSSGMDLAAAITEDVTIRPGERALIPTGLVFRMDHGYEVQIRPRSGLAAKHGVTVLNSPGTVDSDYRGEVQVLLINLDKSKDFIVHRGDRIAQMVFSRIVHVKLLEVKDVNFEGTVRAAGGFGSTGKRPLT
jgi:dUTP pyrophosphatase